MSDTFPVTFLQLALEITGAERGMALDGDTKIIGLVNMTEDDTTADGFSGFANVRQAYEKNERPHITNNTILDEEAAPDTNTNFANLRVVIVFPMDDNGSVYIDQHVGRGVIPKTDAEKLMQVATHAIENNILDADHDVLKTLYETL